MSKQQHTDHHEENFENIERALTSTEQFIENNRKRLTYGTIALIALVAIVIGYHKLYKAPLEKEAIAQIAGAQNYFGKGEYTKALKGDGNKLGFNAVIADYSSTTAGNTAKAYAGVCYLKLGKYDKAIELLKDFSSDDFLVSQLAISNIGDAYMEKGKFNEAASSYEKAAKDKTNNFTTPVFLMKAGNAYEMAKNYKKALAIYEKVEKEHSKSMEARDIEKYITRAKLLLK
ncbi:tetratricopeptide repeat protein [Marinilabiliaceae bacterium JC040]|nr:tetratricopeptide repeat protein [Marinilabiliaceae bacterium JC040]